MISVNNIQISDDLIFKEMQYHPSESKEQAQFQAAQSLVIDELIRQRAVELELLSETDKVNDQVVTEVLARDVITPRSDEVSCKHYYEQNLEKFRTFPLMAIRHILLKAAPDDFAAREEMLELANGLVTQLQNDPTKFSRFARQYSACPSKTTEGSLGQISKGQTVPEFEQQILRYEEGLIPTPVESRYGYHVVWIDKKIQGKLLTYEMAKEKIADYLNEKVQRKAIAQYIAQRINEADIIGIDLEVDERSTMQ